MRSTALALTALVLLGSTSWTPDALAAAEPPPRFWHAFTANGGQTTASSRLYVFGGQGGATGTPVMLGDFWYYRVDTGQWTPAPTGRKKPGVRDGVGLSCGGGRCLLSNGRRLGALKESWVYTESTATWSQINCTRYLCPSARGFPAAAYDPLRDQHLVYGGEPSNTVFYLDDTYTYSAGKWTARNVSNRPPARATAAAAFAGGSVNMVVMFGGAYWKQGPGYYYWDARCDLWAWDGAKWLPITMRNAGPCLAFPAMAWDPVNQQLIVGSGETLHEGGMEIPNRDAWYFKFDTGSKSSGTWTKDAGSGFLSCALNASPYALMAYDIPRAAKVFFGGLQNTSQGVASYANTTVCY